MKKIIMILSLLWLTSSHLAYADGFTVNGIGTQKLDNSGQHFAIEIQITPTQNFQNWALGFYMPKTFNTLDNLINPKLKMTITSLDNQSHTALRYITKRLAGRSRFYGEGYSNVLAPFASHPFSLLKGKTYFIRLANSNQSVPMNFSSLPQSFFIVDNFRQANEHVYTTTSPLIDLRNINGYNQEQVSRRIRQHILYNWNSSKPRNNSLADRYHLLPSPKKIELNGPGYFDLASKNSISINGDYSPLLQQYLLQDLKKNLVISNGFHNDIRMQRMSSLNNPEAYELDIQADHITIYAKTAAGEFYAIQTLRQLWLHNPQHLPLLKITDEPRMRYRGILLDVARHYFAVKNIKKLIDAMATLKLNALHLHLSDDEGFRLALHTVAALGDGVLKKASTRGYVLGSVMNASMYQQANWDKSNYKDQTVVADEHALIKKSYPNAVSHYSGLYSQADIKELIAYANARQITVIPEIDLPGHARALIQAKPELFVDANDTSQFISVQGYDDDVLPVCLYEKQTPQGIAFTQTMNDMITEINTLFSKQSTVYFQPEVSVGGDEVASQSWTHDSSCDGPWQRLSALDKSQRFFKRLQKNTNVTLSGWQQIVQLDNMYPFIPAQIGSQAMPATSSGHIYLWDPVKTGIPNAKILASYQYPTVLAFADRTYFDLSYTPDAWEPGFYWAGSFLDTHAALDSVTALNQVLDSLPESKRSYIKGLEGTLWSENINNFRHLAYMALPKITGLAEASWAPIEVSSDHHNRINWQSLAYRLSSNSQKSILDDLYHITHMIYRGYPDGIAWEMPTRRYALR